MNKRKHRRMRRLKLERRRAVAFAEANVRLREELLRTEQECSELRDANANLVVERDAADILLADALDQGLSGSGS